MRLKSCASCNTQPHRYLHRQSSGKNSTGSEALRMQRGRGRVQAGGISGKLRSTGRQGRDSAAVFFTVRPSPPAAGPALPPARHKQRIPGQVLVWDSSQLRPRPENDNAFCWQSLLSAWFGKQVLAPASATVAFPQCCLYLRVKPH